MQNDRRRHQLFIRISGGALAVAALVVLSAGCGGGSKSPGVAALGTTTTTPATTTTGTGGDGQATQSGGSRGSLKVQGGAQFSACMRSHGVRNFPDPSSSGALTFNARNGVDPNSPQFQAAQRACRKYLPNGGNPPSPAEQARMQAQALQFSACMRSHGVPTFPDPQFSQGSVGIKIDKDSVNPNSPQFQAAQKACEKYLPGLKKGTAGGGSKVVSGGTG